MVDSLSLISAMYLLRSGWVLSVIGDCVTDLYRVMCGVCGVQIRKYSDSSLLVANILHLPHVPLMTCQATARAGVTLEQRHLAAQKRAAYSSETTSDPDSYREMRFCLLFY